MTLRNRSVVCGVVALAGLGGCSGTEEVLSGGGGGTAITAEAFRGEGSARAAEAPGSEAGVAARGPMVVPAEVAGEGLRGVVSVVGEPERAVNPGAGATGEGVVLEAMIGQVNGKPIYASRFLAPLDARLRAKRAESRNNAAWQREAKVIIGNQLMDKIRDELFLAEARAELSPEQRAGLFAFLNQVRDTLASVYGGSREEAEERLQAKEGESFEGKVESEKNRALVASIVRKYILPRVNVSWRDVTRQYERDYGTYNPPAVASIRMIAVDGASEEGARSVAEALASGKAFAEAAELPANVFPRGSEGVVSAKFEGDISQARLFENDTLNEQARRLTPGGVVGPFEYQKRRVWLHLEEVKRPEGLGLEEVQLKVAEALRASRFNAEAERFLSRLKERASFTNVESMADRLVAIASERYLVNERLRP